MASELIAYEQFLERREQRRTADRGRGFPGAAGIAEPSAGGSSVMECEPIGAPRPPARAAGPVTAAAVAAPRIPQPVPPSCTES
jgi:hypothetical protein